MPVNDGAGQRVKQLLRQHMQSGLALPTQKQIASEMNATQATVSRIMSRFEIINYKGNSYVGKRTDVSRHAEPEVEAAAE